MNMKQDDGEHSMDSRLNFPLCLHRVTTEETNKRNKKLPVGAPPAAFSPLQTLGMHSTKKLTVVLQKLAGKYQEREITFYIYIL